MFSKFQIDKSKFKAECCLLQRIIRVNSFQQNYEFTANKSQATLSLLHMFILFPSCQAVIKMQLNPSVSESKHGVSQEDTDAGSLSQEMLLRCGCLFWHSGRGSIQILYLSKSTNTTLKIVTSKSPALKNVNEVKVWVYQLKVLKLLNAEKWPLWLLFYYIYII